MLTELKGEILNPIELGECIKIGNSFPEIHHRYGQPPPYAPEPFWMRYMAKNEDNFICFFRNTHLNPVLKEMQETISMKLRKLFTDIEINPNKVQFMKTRGVIPPHIDEANRMCCLNIGVRNSASATTIYSKVDTKSEIAFLANSQKYTCRDGYGVLLNTNSIHSVMGNTGVERILITYGFEARYEYVKSKLRSEL